MLTPQIAPNAAHYALAKLEAEFRGRFTLITQNIDDLHTRAGSKNILQMHGELLKVRCIYTGEIFVRTNPVERDTLCECCNLEGTLRPHIVWFEEMPLYLDDIYSAVEHCDLFVAIGTSGNVYPAAGLVQSANQVGANTLEINLERSNTANQFQYASYGKASDLVPKWVESLIK